jgi:hypothetical protein
MTFFLYAIRLHRGGAKIPFSGKKLKQDTSVFVNELLESAFPWHPIRVVLRVNYQLERIGEKKECNYFLKNLYTNLVQVTCKENLHESLYVNLVRNTCMVKMREFLQANFNKKLAQKS